jgi:hypothetical protein
MKSQQLFLIRSRVIEGRRQARGQRGRLVRIKSLGLRGRLLVHPSKPLHYVTLQPVTSGAWRSQKRQEAVLVRGETIWECDLFEQIHRRVPLKWRDELSRFLDLVRSENVNQLWLDSNFQFWSEEWPGWFFRYSSQGTLEQLTGTALAFRRSSLVYTGVCCAGITQDIPKRPSATR